MVRGCVRCALYGKAPASGGLAVSPSAGFALEKAFAFASLNWVDEDLPFSYIFGTAPVRSDGLTVDSALVTLEPFGAYRRGASLSEVVLPQGADPGFWVGCFSKVADSFGATTVSTTAAQVSKKVEMSFLLPPTLESIFYHDFFTLCLVAQPQR
jgi:hypothetical protein